VSEVQNFFTYEQELLEMQVGLLRLQWGAKHSGTSCKRFFEAKPRQSTQTRSLRGVERWRWIFLALLRLPICQSQEGEELVFKVHELQSGKFEAILDSKSSQRRSLDRNWQNIEMGVQVVPCLKLRQKIPRKLSWMQWITHEFFQRRLWNARSDLSYITRQSQ
jgi:hypothetical protein